DPMPEGTHGVRAPPLSPLAFTLPHAVAPSGRSDRVALSPYARARRPSLPRCDRVRTDEPDGLREERHRTRSVRRPDEADQRRLLWRARLQGSPAPGPAEPPGALRGRRAGGAVRRVPDPLQAPARLAERPLRAAERVPRPSSSARGPESHGRADRATERARRRALRLRAGRAGSVDPRPGCRLCPRGRDVPAKERRLRPAVAGLPAVPLGRAEGPPGARTAGPRDVGSRLSRASAPVAPEAAPVLRSARRRSRAR